jgi:hypothetical protein
VSRAIKDELDRSDLDAVSPRILGAGSACASSADKSSTASCAITMPMLTVPSTGSPSTSLVAAANELRICSATAGARSRVVSCDSAAKPSRAALPAMIR